MKPSDARFHSGTYEQYLQAIRKCGFCHAICVRAEPECCELARGLRPEQVDAVAKMAEERLRYHNRIADIACLACEELSPNMRSVVARAPSNESPSEQ